MVYDLESFIRPGEKMLTDGTLTEFSEWEVAERTEVFGSIAHRFSEYRKSGIRDDGPVRTDACRLADERDGLG